MKNRTLPPLQKRLVVGVLNGSIGVRVQDELASATFMFARTKKRVLVCRFELYLPQHESLSLDTVTNPGKLVQYRYQKFAGQPHPQKRVESNLYGMFLPGRLRVRILAAKESVSRVEEKA